MASVTQAPDIRKPPTVCSTPDCGAPVTDVAFWTEQARATVPPYWHEEFTAAGHPTSPEGLCSDCGAEWLYDLRDYRDEHRCDGHCSPYDNCLCQLMLPESEY